MSGASYLYDSGTKANHNNNKKYLHLLHIAASCKAACQCINALVSSRLLCAGSLEFVLSPFPVRAHRNECAFVQIKAICTNIKYSINKAGVFNHDIEILRIALTLIILQEGRISSTLPATAP